MKKAVNNLTDAPLTLGGVEIEAKSQRVVRESLISDEEKQAIQETGAVMAVSFSEITVAVKSDEDKEAELVAKAEAEAKAKADENKDAEIKDVAYPAEYIKNDGTLNGQPALKAKIAQLQAVYGETILNDADFKAKHADADIEAYRVEVGA